MMRFVTPWPYSWAITSPQRSESRSGLVRLNWNIPMIGGVPSGGVAMKALLSCRGFAAAPNWALASTRSLPRPPSPKLFCWKLPAASSKPNRYQLSWQMLFQKKRFVTAASV